MNTINFHPIWLEGKNPPNKWAYFISVFHSGIHPAGKALRASGWAPRGNVTENFFGGFARDFIVGSGEVFRGAFGRWPRGRRGEKIFFAFVWAGGKNEEKM
jgi:hypothetical protein